jgi:hypothetical protein
LDEGQEAKQRSGIDVETYSCCPEFGDTAQRRRAATRGGGVSDLVYGFDANTALQLRAKRKRAGAKA